MGLGTVGISQRWLIAEYLRCSTLPGAGGPFHLFFAEIHSPLLLSHSVPCIHTSSHCSLPAAVLAWNSRPQHKGQKKKKGVFISRLIYCSQSQNKNTTFWKCQALGRKVSSLNWRCPVTRTLFQDSHWCPNTGWSHGLKIQIQKRLGHFLGEGRECVVFAFFHLINRMCDSK